MDIDMLKAELKAFEQSFRETHGRKPGSADIQERPEMGETVVYRFVGLMGLSLDRQLASTSSMLPFMPNQNKQYHSLVQLLQA